MRCPPSGGEPRPYPHSTTQPRVGAGAHITQRSAFALPRPPPFPARPAQAVSLGISDKCIAGGARLFGGCSVEIAQAQRAFNLKGDPLVTCAHARARARAPSRGSAASSAASSWSCPPSPPPAAAAPPPIACRRNYTSKLQQSGVPQAEVEAFIRTQLSFSAGCCRDACRFSYMQCGCEPAVVTLAMRLIGAWGAARSGVSH